MAINLIDVGATANDGTGDPIRSAFQTVNDNFDFINGGLYAGTQSSLISAISVTGGYLVSNSYVLATTYVNAASIVGNTVTSNGNLFVSQQGAYIVGNVTIVGNLSVSGSQAAAQSQASSASLLNLHYSAAPLVLDDSRDIGLVWQYYTTGPEKKSFLGWQNSTESLIYWDDITESIANVITAGTPGNVQIGSLLIANTTSSTSNVTGALQVMGGVGILGNLNATRANIGNISVTGYHVGDLNFVGSDTIFINGSPVQTAAQAFNGGSIGLQTTFNDATPATSVGSGAVLLPNGGGIGVVGNIWAGNIHTTTAGNVRANVQGNIFTAAQPYITSLGTLTGLVVAGQINSRNLVPETNLTYSIGTSNTTRWSKIWAFDTDFSGAMTLSGEVTSTANINLNRATVVGIRTTTAIAEIFNQNATTVRIGAAGVTEFDNNTQAISTTTGALQLKGGMSINTGNLYIGGSGGNSLITTGRISIDSNVQATSTTTGALKSNGGISITTGNLYIGGSGGNAIIHSDDIIPASNLSSNIGSLTGWYSNVHATTFRGTSITAQYADLAEKYISDNSYEVGTVVVFGGEQEITVTNEFADPRVAGVISTAPAYLMNDSIDGLPVALRGRVPVRVVGPVNKGDLLVTSSTFGYARSVGRDNSYNSAVFAKSLIQDSSNGNKIIEAVII